MRKHIDVNLLQEILNYLASRPFSEVYKMIEWVMKDSQDYEVPPAVTAPTSENSPAG